jgi:AP2 domain
MNNIEIFETHAVMYIKSKGEIFEVLIDVEDIPKVQQFKWFILRKPHTNYVVTKKAPTKRLHRYLLNCEDESIIVDHKDRNGLNNQKLNLRETTQSINNRNANTRVSESSGVRGVRYDESRDRWVVQWFDLNKKRYRKTFPVKTYGSKAKEMAIEFRKQMERENGYLQL